MNVLSLNSNYVAGNTRSYINSSKMKRDSSEKPSDKKSKQENVNSNTASLTCGHIIRNDILARGNDPIALLLGRRYCKD